ncbi:MAG TPA: DUF1080 domain-containing protein [Rhodopila sp.]|nr:DUF1080 domain-containing protein [Rhodopila sp.]
MLGRSGVFVRFPNPGNDPQVAVNQGYEIQIDDLGQPDNAPIHRTGAIYNFAAPSRLASRLMGEWNDLEIRVQGQNYTVTLNGEQVTTFAGNPGGQPAKALSACKITIRARASRSAIFGFSRCET